MQYFSNNSLKVNKNLLSCPPGNSGRPAKLVCVRCESGFSRRQDASKVGSRDWFHLTEGVWHLTECVCPQALQFRLRFAMYLCLIYSMWLHCHSAAIRMYQRSVAVPTTALRVAMSSLPSPSGDLEATVARFYRCDDCNAEPFSSSDKYHNHRTLHQLRADVSLPNGTTEIITRQSEQSAWRCPENDCPYTSSYLLRLRGHLRDQRKKRKRQEETEARPTVENVESDIRGESTTDRCSSSRSASPEAFRRVRRRVETRAVEVRRAVLIHIDNANRFLPRRALHRPFRNIEHPACVAGRTRRTPFKRFLWVLYA